MRTELFDFHLPREAVAVRPPVQRDGGRMLVVEREGTQDSSVRDWPHLVPAGSLVVLNDTRVFKARLLGRRRESGGRVELLLLEPVTSGQRRGQEVWHALGRASKPLRTGCRLDFGACSATVIDREEDGTLTVALSTSGPLEAALAADGHVPLPPYLSREDEPEDVERYQTVYAKNTGSVAAPTAGLHLTKGLLSRLRDRGVEVEAITLHVGVGTFRPVKVDDLNHHSMHSERLTVGLPLVQAVERARQRGTGVVAVGTTVVRALESAADPQRPGHVRESRGRTDLMIQPGYRFQVVDALLTNFHLPRSTLVALVAAFAGRQRVLDAYETALRRGYRFLSYGDAMWLPHRLEG